MDINKVIKRFWSKVDIKSEDECWNWLTGRYKDNCGMFSINHNTTVRASRFVYEITYKKIPDGMFVCHICDNPSCCNPKHLFLGTTQDNTKDRVNKNRSAKGEKCGMSKLCNEEIKKIKLLYKSGISMLKISEKFKVNRTTINRIIRKKTWRDIK